MQKGTLIAATVALSFVSRPVEAGIGEERCRDVLHREAQELWRGDVQTTALLAGWLDGYVAGRGLNSAEIHAWLMDKYCPDHPTETIRAGVDSLLKALQPPASPPT